MKTQNTSSRKGRKKTSKALVTTKPAPLSRPRDREKERLRRELAKANKFFDEQEKQIAEERRLTRDVIGVVQKTPRAVWPAKAAPPPDLAQNESLFAELHKNVLRMDLAAGDLALLCDLAIADLFTERDTARFQDALRRLNVARRSLTKSLLVHEERLAELSTQLLVTAFAADEATRGGMQEGRGASTP